MPSQAKSTFFPCCCDADGWGQWSQSHKTCEFGFNWKAVIMQEPNGLSFLALKRRKSYSTTQQVSGVQLQLHGCFIECPTFCLSKGKLNQVYNFALKNNLVHKVFAGFNQLIWTFRPYIIANIFTIKYEKDPEACITTLWLCCAWHSPTL